jgi:hypothetical protein
VLNDIKEEGLEIALNKFGAQVQHGKGVAAVQEILLEAY